MDDFLYSHTLYSDYSPDFLKNLYFNSRGVEFRVFNNTDNESFFNEAFLNVFAKEHPFLKIMVGWAGNVFIYTMEKEKGDYKELDIKEQNNGHLYVDLHYSIEKLNNELDKSFEGSQYTEKNKYWTPVVCPMIEVDENITYTKGEKYILHPFIRIGKTLSGHYFSDDYYNNNKRYFYKIFNDEKKGDYISIPIYVYRLVAEAFLNNPNPRKYNQVHHILNNGYNNCALNLMWVTDEQHCWLEGRKPVTEEKFKEAFEDDANEAIKYFGWDKESGDEEHKRTPALDLTTPEAKEIIREWTNNVKKVSKIPQDTRDE